MPFSTGAGVCGKDIVEVQAALLDEFVGREDGVVLAAVARGLASCMPSVPLNHGFARKEPVSPTASWYRFEADSLASAEVGRIGVELEHRALLIGRRM